MPSPGSIIVAHCFLAPATLVWCKLVRDNPAEGFLRAWCRAFLLPTMLAAETSGSAGPSFDQASTAPRSAPINGDGKDVQPQANAVSLGPKPRRQRAEAA
jgi:hypothetical protein